MSNYKSTDALMRHLRNNGISISGSSQKQQLINTGQYDTKLKSLLYGKMMLIETALKNIALNTIMAEIDSNSIYDMYDKAVSSYKNAPPETPEDIKKKFQNNKSHIFIIP